MRTEAIAEIHRMFPNTFGFAKDPLDQEVDQERQRLLDLLLELYFDSLLPNMLRKPIFLKMYWTIFPELEVKAKSRRAHYALQRIEKAGKGAFFFGDAAYLKLANNVSREHGDHMLSLIAEYIAAASFRYYGRFREGDEFVACHDSVDEGIADVEHIATQLAEHEISGGLPMAIDFGHVEHREVAKTYLRLLREGWQPEVGRTAIQVFFDIGLKIAEIRAAVQKVYNRAFLLFYYYELAWKNSPEASYGDYEKFKDLVTRGGKFVEPKESWLSLTEEGRSEVIRLEALSLLSPPADASLFDRVVTEVAESIYLVKK